MIDNDKRSILEEDTTNPSREDALRRARLRMMFRRKTAKELEEAYTVDENTGEIVV